MAQAQCLCGDVAYEVEPPFAFVHDCHCRRCQKSHGTGSATWGFVPAGRFRWLRGEDARSHFETRPGSERAFCLRCGSITPNEAEVGPIRFFPLGPLEGDFEPSSEGHLFVASKAPWHDIDDGLPTHAAFPPGDAPPVLDDLARAPAGPGRVGGSCLCGELAWDFAGPPLLMRRCHCQRCRRARAHSHAANALVAEEGFRWTRGEAQVRLFKLPEAERFSQAFCGACGGKAPWHIPARRAWNVPLGALDDDPGAKPSEHIFVGSKARWFEIRDALPQHQTVPPWVDPRAPGPQTSSPQESSR